MGVVLAIADRILTLYSFDIVTLRQARTAASCCETADDVYQVAHQAGCS